MNDKQEWEVPEIEDLGDAKDEIKSISVVGTGDSQFSILDPT